MLHNAKSGEIVTTAMPGFQVILLPQEGETQSLDPHAPNTQVATQHLLFINVLFDLCLSPYPTF